MFMIKCILFVYTLTNQYFSLEAMMTGLIFANKASAEFKWRLCIWDILLKFQDKVRMMIVFFFLNGLKFWNQKPNLKLCVNV